MVSVTIDKLFLIKSPTTKFTPRVNNETFKNHVFRSYRMIYFGFSLKKKLSAILGGGWYFRDFLNLDP